MCERTCNSAFSYLQNCPICGQAPEIWKEAIVIPVPKVTNPHSVTESRPISINSVSCKVLEKIIRDKLLDWIEKFKLIPPEQHGFSSGASTVTQLLDCTHDWINAVLNDKEGQLIYFALSKAFDRISYEKLLFKLDHYSIRGDLLNWFKSYLQDRKMTVRVV